MVTPSRYLVTAGNTRELIDRVRDWGNIFTGNTGYAIARALTALGPVDLLTSNRQHLAEIAQENSPAFRGFAFTSHAELKAALAERMSAQPYAGVFMTAAVADYRPAGAFAVLERRPSPDGDGEIWHVRSAQAGKVKSSHPAVAFLGTPTEKLVDLFRTTWNHRGLLVKFKLEVDLAEAELIQVASASRLASGADYLVANTLAMVSGPRAGAFLLSDAAPEWVAREQLPQRLLQVARDHAAQQTRR